MVYTVTLNPALDMAAPGGFSAGGVARYGQGAFLAGGKGINVSRLLTALGVGNLALGLCAGFTGREVARQLEAAGIPAELLFLEEGCTRINLKLQEPGGPVVELNGEGPQVPLSALEQIGERCRALGPGDFLVLAGSIPGSLPRDAYARLLSYVEGRGVYTVVDAAGEALGAVLPCRPFLVKPNQQELGEFFGGEVSTIGQAAKYAGELRRMGAQNVVVSLGGQGALLAGDGGQLFCRAAQGEAASTVGAGDSLVAGFIYGWGLHLSAGESLRWGVAAGCATAFSQGIASGEAVKALYPRIHVEPFL